MHKKQREKVSAVSKLAGSKPAEYLPRAGLETRTTLYCAIQAACVDDSGARENNRLRTRNISMHDSW